MQKNLITKYQIQEVVINLYRISHYNFLLYKMKCDIN